MHVTTQELSKSLSYAIVQPDDFARRFSLRCMNLMWLLGAGASAAAGIPTAGEMILEFKQRLYISKKHVQPKSVSDLSNPVIRKVIQDFIDGLGVFPKLWAPDEYAAIFEATYTQEADRRSYIDSKLKYAKPSFGHIALATLMKADLARIVWTTNFDALIADACAKVFDSTGYLTSIALDAPELARETLHNQRWPAEIKLHGDFRSSRLKNTSEELKQQDTALRQLFIDASQRHGLIVAGYSGRDESIMETLRDALKGASPFPHGFFWLHRSPGEPLESVIEILSEISDRKIDGGLVPIDNFDETMRDLLRLLHNRFDPTFIDSFAADRKIWSAPPKLIGNGNFPYIRLNALEIKSLPTVCRLIGCRIGNQSEVNLAVKTKKRPVLAVRKKIGVLAFGSDDHINEVFSPYTIDRFDLHTIDTKKLQRDSQERGLIRQALSYAIANNLEMKLLRKRTADLLYPSNCNDKRWSVLKKIVGNLHGAIPNHLNLLWYEGIGIRLDYNGPQKLDSVLSSVLGENRGEK